VERKEQGAETGAVAALCRYPVKSMLGEELEEALVTRKGFAEDRAYAVTDVESGRVLSANRAGWGGLFGFYAALEHGPDGEG
jgi:MOSC domain-containing protein